MSEEFRWIAIAVVSVMSIARITRLVTWDHFPPSMWIRNTYDQKIAKGGPWALLVFCGYCFSVWASALVVGWGYLADFNTPWFVFNGFLAAAYAGAIVMTNDGDEG